MRTPLRTLIVGGSLSRSTASQASPRISPGRIAVTNSQPAHVAVCGAVEGLPQLGCLGGRQRSTASLRAGGRRQRREAGGVGPHVAAGDAEVEDLDDDASDAGEAGTRDRRAFAAGAAAGTSGEAVEGALDVVGGECVQTAGGRVRRRRGSTPTDTARRSSGRGVPASAPARRSASGRRVRRRSCSRRQRPCRPPLRRASPTCGQGGRPWWRRVGSAVCRRRTTAPPSGRRGSCTRSPEVASSILASPTNYSLGSLKPDLATTKSRDSAARRRTAGQSTWSS
jgi:hypothetical protein